MKRNAMCKFYIYIYTYIHIYIYIYDEETILSHPADKQICNYDTECSSHHPSNINLIRYRDQWEHHATVRKCPYNTRKGIPATIQKDHIKNHKTCLVKRKKKHYYSLTHTFLPAW